MTRVLAQRRPGGRVRRGAGRVWPASVWASLLLEPRDLWVGVYWDRPDVSWDHAVDIYICLVPMLPVKLAVRCVGWERWVTDIHWLVRERRFGHEGH